MTISTAGINLVLMTTDTIGGVWTYALELIRALENRGIEVVLATMGNPLDVQQRRTVSAFDYLTVCESRFRLEWMENPWRDVRAAGDWLLKIEQLYRPNLIHLNGFAHGALSWQAPCLVVGHSCVFSWYEAVHMHAPPPIWRRYHEMVSRGLTAADRVTAPSRTMLQSMKKHYGAFAEAEPIYNGRTSALFRPLRKKHYILSAGRIWDEAKNMAVLERVAPFVTWPIRIAGECRRPDGVRKEFLGVEYLGRLSPRQMAFQMGQAAVFVLPAHYEPFGLSALEAGLSGCALVLGDIPSLREIWGDAAIFVPPDRPEILRFELERLIENTEFRKQMAQMAFERALVFTPERMVGQYVLLYKSIARHPSGKRIFQADAMVNKTNKNMKHGPRLRIVRSSPPFP